MRSLEYWPGDAQSPPEILFGTEEGVDLSPILRQTVKTQISLNGELSHGIVS